MDVPMSPELKLLKQHVSLLTLPASTVNNGSVFCLQQLPKLIVRNAGQQKQRTA